jgi:ATP-dependent protease Clp ATPase subunit
MNYADGQGPHTVGRVAGARDLVLCSFCGAAREEVEAVIGGRLNVYICDRCVRRAQAVVAEPGVTADTPIATIQQVSDEAGAEECTFCGKPRHRVAAMASAADKRICTECLELCEEILR